VGAYSDWGKEQFGYYQGSVIFLEVEKEDKEKGIGTAFHIGDGVFVTARHVVEGNRINEIATDAGYDPFRGAFGEPAKEGLTIVTGPFYHPDDLVDLACFKVDKIPANQLPLGGHLDCFLGPYELLLHRTLVLGFPPVPISARPHLLACFGEINGLIELYIGSKHPMYVVSTTARGGFSGAPVLVAYDEQNKITGTAVLGVVVESLVKDGSPPEIGYMTVTTVEPIYDMLEHHGLLPESQRLELE